jgi:hypothetical protein
VVPLMTAKFTVAVAASSPSPYMSTCMTIARRSDRDIRGDRMLRTPAIMTAVDSPGKDTLRFNNPSLRQKRRRSTRSACATSAASVRSVLPGSDNV